MTAFVPSQYVATPLGNTFGAHSLTLNAFTSSVVAGSYIWVTHSYTGTSLPAAPTDSQGNTYTYVGFCGVTDGSSEWTGHYYTLITTGGSLTVTVKTDGSGTDQYMGGVAVELPMPAGSSFAGHSELESAPSTTGANNVVSGSASITAGLPITILALAQNIQGNACGAAGTSPIAFTSQATIWNGFGGDTSNIGQLEYAVVSSSPSSVQATAQQANAFDTYLMVMAVFAGPPPPTITSQPTTQRVPLGVTATLTVTATGAVGPLTYQWQLNTGSGFSNITGATSASYTTGALAYSDNASTYQCVITDTGNSTTATTNIVRAIADFNTSGTAHLRAFQVYAGGPFATGAFSPWVTGAISGGNVYNVSITETVSASDAPSIMLVAAASVAESGAASDSVSDSDSTLVAIAEAGSASDSVAGALSTPQAIVESGAAVDSVASVAIFAPAIVEAGSAADSASAADLSAPAIVESASAADSPSAALVTAQAVSESGAAVDSVSTSGASSVALAESGTAIDTTDAARLSPGDIVEAGTAVDTPSATNTSPGAIAESGSAVDAVSTSGSSGVAIVEAETAVDAPSAIAFNGQFVSESLAATDAPSATAILNYAIAEAAAAGDFPSAAAILGAALSEGLSALDAIGVQRFTPAAITESGAAVDSASALLSIAELIAEALAATDASGASAALVAQAIEFAAAQDVEDAAAVLGAALAEVAAAVDRVDNSTGQGVTVSEAAAAQDTLNWVEIAFTLLRLFIYPPESRIFAFPPDSRLYAFGPDTRNFKFPAETRTYAFTETTDGL